jgi:hypothetical protein
MEDAMAEREQDSQEIPGHTGTKRRKSERGEEESEVPEDPLPPLLLGCTPIPFTE